MTDVIIPVVCQTCKHQPPWMLKTNDLAGRCRLHDLIVFDWDSCGLYEFMGENHENTENRPDKADCDE